MSSSARLLVALAMMFPGAALAADDPTAKFHLKPGAAGTICLGCHADFQDVLKRPHVHTPVKAGNCAGCHDPHASTHGKLLEDDSSKICASCHGSMIPEGAKSAHAAVAQGKCVSCHDPHGSPNKANLVRAGNELCLGCHADIKAGLDAATHKHGPVTENCLNCHDPHASKTAPSLLAKSPPALCTGCHNPSQPGFGKAHMGYPVAASNCLSCHDPHGSPNKGILWASVHAPVANKQCVQCHGAPPAAGPVVAKRLAPELCRGCHNALFVEIDGRKRVHAPVLEPKSCANCHTPHASKADKLLLAPQKALCGTCHADSVARQAKSLVKHPPVDEGQCSTCHAPHAADETFLFEQANVMDLCGACHEWKNHSSHPIGEKAIDKRNPNLTVNCLSCHRSHGTAFKSFAHADTKNELCTQCHIELAR